MSLLDRHSKNLGWLPVRLRSLNVDHLALFALFFVQLTLNLTLHLQGLEFNLDPLHHYYQFLDPAWLQDNLLASLLYQHSQPPLFNFFIGLSLKGFGETPLVFEIFFQILALLTIWGMFLTLRLLKVNLLLSCLLVLGLIFYPAFIYFQHYLFYPLPVITLLVLALYLLVRGELDKDRRYLYVFFMALATLSLLRSTYNPLYVIAVLILLVVLRWSSRRTLLVASLPALAILGILVAKNVLLFDQLSTSSWLGMNLAKSSVQALTDVQKRSLVEAGLVSDVVLVPPFQDIYEYPAGIWQAAVESCQGPPALCEPFKRSGDPNFNYAGYLPISSAYLRAGLYAIRHYPLQYLQSARQALRLYFTPAHRTVGVGEAEFDLLRPWADPIDNFLCEKIADQYGANRCTPFAVGVVTLVSFAVVLCILPLNRPEPGIPGSNLRCLATCFIVLTVLYNFLLGVLVDVGENNRFRFEIDPLLLILLGIVLQGVIDLVQSRRRARENNQSSTMGTPDQQTSGNTS